MLILIGNILREMLFTISKAVGRTSIKRAPTLVTESSKQNRSSLIDIIRSLGHISALGEKGILQQKTQNFPIGHRSLSSSVSSALGLEVKSHLLLTVVFSEILHLVVRLSLYKGPSLGTNI